MPVPNVTAGQPITESWGDAVSDSVAALEAGQTAHAAAADPHAGYRLESADHSHASTGLQAGQVAHGALSGLASGDDHTQYQKESEKGAAGGYAGLDSGGKLYAALLPAGTAFPGSPAAGDRFFRTDRGIDYYYDGTRWLSVTLYEWTEGLGLFYSPQGVDMAASTYGWAARTLAGGTQLYLVALDVSWRVTGGTALSASHKWSVRLRTDPTAVVPATAEITSGTLATVNALASVASGSVVGTAGHNVLLFDSEKTGTPGTFSAAARLTYRLVG